jgi:tetratricopeptide (TPR) repeat protein
MRGLRAGKERFQSGPFKATSQAASLSSRDVIRLNNQACLHQSRQEYTLAHQAWTRAIRSLEQQQRDVWQPKAMTTASRGLLTTRSDDLSSMVLSPCRSSTPPRPTTRGAKMSAVWEEEAGPTALWNRLQQHVTTSSPAVLEDDRDDDVASLTSVMTASSATDEDWAAHRNNTQTGSAGIGKSRAEYDEGMDYFRQPWELPVSDSVDNGCIPATLWYNYGRWYHQQGQAEDAMKYYKRAHRALPSNDSSSFTDLVLSILFGMGHVLYMRGDHTEALQSYMKALAVARRHGKDQETLHVAACMNAVGVLHYIMPKGDSETALQALKAALTIRQRHLGPAHPQVGTTWNNIGRVYFQQGTYDRAMQAYRHALKIRQRPATDNSGVDVAATIFNIGQVHHQRGDRDRALRHYQQFLKLSRQHFGDFHRDICIVTTCIGQVLHERKEYKKALKAFTQALKIGKVALGSVHAEIAITLNKLGNLYYDFGDLDAALRTYHQGLQVELEVLEPGNPNVCVTYTNIAEIHKQRGEYDHALRHYEKVLVLQRKYSPDLLDVANTLSSIGYVRHQIGDYPGAMEVNQECLRIRRDIKGDNDEEVASTLTHIALVLLKMEMHDMALGVLTEAYRIRMANNVATTENRDVAFTLYNIALIYHHQGAHEEALRFYRETARVEHRALGGAHRDLSITYYNIGQIYYQRGEMELAISHFEQALSIELQCFGRNHPTCARTLNEIGNIELQRGNLPGVMRNYTEACRIYRASGLSEDQLVIYGRSLWRFELVQPNAAPVA